MAQSAHVPDGAAGRGEPADLLERAREQLNSGDLLAAEDSCATALRLRPDDAEAHRVMGKILLWQNRADDAVASLTESLRLEPEDVRTYTRLAQAYAAQGRMDDAVAADRRALELAPAHVAAHSHLASLKRFTSCDDGDLAAIEALAAGEALADGDRSVLLFALAKAHEELGSYDRAFACLQEANALARQTVRWDPADAAEGLSRIREVFSAELLERLSGAGAPSELPVLIVGMPRSGTTLVEQILASHPAVHGGGERPDLIEIAEVTSMLTNGGLPFPDSVAGLSREDLLGLGEGYARRLGDLAPGAARVTDKTPRNFRFLGLVRVMLPKAKVIHCVRDPLDTCFSCYALNLVAQPYTYDLGELGEYYVAYERLMEHWRDVLPPGWVLDVRYEELVADLEAESRRILAHVGVDWDNACLDFSSTDRTVMTASVTQVRRPVYTTSVARWRHFESHLGDLVDALGGERASSPAGD